MSSAAAAANRGLGVDRGLPFPLADLQDGDAILLLGSNLADTMPPAVQHLGPVRGRGGLVVVDPRRSGHRAAHRRRRGGARPARARHRPGVPPRSAARRTRRRPRRRRLPRARVYRASTTCGAASPSGGRNGWPRRPGFPRPSCVASPTCSPTRLPHRGGRGAFVLTGRGAEQHVDGTDTVTAAINLALALGLVGAERGGYGAITGQGNGQGGREHGQKADQLPGYRMIDDPVAREHVAAVWGVDPAIIPGPGVPAVQLLQSLGTADGPRALFVHGSNVVVSAPGRRRRETSPPTRSTSSSCATSCPRRPRCSPTTSCR